MEYKKIVIIANEDNVTKIKKAELINIEMDSIDLVAGGCFADKAIYLPDELRDNKTGQSFSVDWFLGFGDEDGKCLVPRKVLIPKK